MTHHDEPQEHPEAGAATPSTDAQGHDPDADPGNLNPQDLRGVETGDGALAEEETDSDPEQLNPRG